jgi:capsular exopolysaccharide synthesis family protein
VLASELVGSLRGELAKAESERSALAQKVGPEYPALREANARVAQLRERLNGEIRNVVFGIETANRVAKIRVDELQAELDRHRVALLEQKDEGADYESLQREVETNRVLYASLLQRLTDMGVADQVRVSNVSLVEPATPPTIRSSPRAVRNLLLALMLGLGVGLGLAFFLEAVDDTVKTPEDVSDRLGLATLGVVGNMGAHSWRSPPERRLASPKKVRRLLGHRDSAPGDSSAANSLSLSEELVAHRDPRSILSEACWTIQTGLLLSRPDDPPRTMVVTSASEGEGKTFTTVNLALTFVESGAGVLLIDGDLRKPRLHKLFSVPNDVGFSTLLVGQAKLDESIHEIATPGRSEGDARGGGRGRLCVMPAGPAPPNPAQILQGKRLRAVIEEARGLFDIVLIDSPPVLPVSDAVLLGNVSDGAVFVIRGQHCRVDVADKALDRLAYGRVTLLGVVLNGVDLASTDYDEYRSHSSYTGMQEA